MPGNVVAEARGRISRRLGGFDWKPPGLDENAILCARSLRLPMDVSIAHPHELIPPESSRKAMASALDELLRSAVRPVNQAVPANAPAVLFRDGADLLVCLARDWLRRDAVHNWWWTTLFPGKSIETAVSVAWAENAQQVPVALTRLHSARLAEPFLAALDVNVVSQMLERLTQGTPISPLRDTMIESIKVVVTAAHSSETELAESTTEPDVLKTHEESMPGAPPWSRWIVTKDSLSPDAQALIVISVLLQDAPMLVCATSFRRAIEDWAQRACDRERFQAIARASTPLVSHETSSPDRTQQQPEPSQDDTEALSEIRFTPPKSEVQISRMAAAIEHREQTPTHFEGTRQPKTHLVPSTNCEIPRTIEPLIESEPMFVSTEWGGIFYLLNIAQALGFYPDFTRPREIGLALCPWEFLGLTGSELSQGEIETDPIWALLANLAGRSANSPPGSLFDPPDAWRIPGHWLLEKVSGEDCECFVSKNRLQLRHVDGFALCDLAIEDNYSLPAIESELATLGLSIEGRTMKINTECCPFQISPLRRWTRWVSEYIEYRLRKAIGPFLRADLVKRVFRCAARVELVSERIILHFKLDDHPIELRFAGLDRDPGWFPAAARSVYFRYE